jgi:hypothetical protein
MDGEEESHSCFIALVVYGDCRVKHRFDSDLTCHLRREDGHAKMWPRVIPSLAWRIKILTRKNLGRYLNGVFFIAISSNSRATATRDSTDVV